MNFLASVPGQGFWIFGIILIVIVFIFRKVRKK